MTKQYSTTIRNDWLDRYEVQIGTSPKLRFMTGAQPTNCATAQSGTQLIEMSLPSDWMADAASGSKAKSGTWSGTVSTSGTAGYYRILNSGGSTCHEQGAITQAFALVTSGPTAANSNLLLFAAATGVVNGMKVLGSGIPSGATVSAVTGTNVLLSVPCPSGVASGTSIYFGDTTGDLWLQTTVLIAGQVVTITEQVRTAPGA